VTQHDEMVYAARARDFGARALDLVAGRGPHDAFVADELRYVPVLHNLQRMSETAASTSAPFRGGHPSVPWNDIVAVSERVAPGFFSDDPEATWDIATGPLAGWVAALDAIVPPGLGDDDAALAIEATAAGSSAERRPRVVIPRDRLEDLCRRYRVMRLRLFGSVLRDDFGPQSDVDVLVEFESGVDIGLQIFDLEEELSELVGGHAVDLIEPEYLDKYVRNRVLRSAEDIYAA